MERRLLGSTVAFALVLAAAAGTVAREADDLLVAASLVILGGCLVGGIAPARWWLATLVGLGVPAVALLGPWSADGAPGLSPASALFAPLVALAAGGLGAALARHLREE